MRNRITFQNKDLPSSIDRFSTTTSDSTTGIDTTSAAHPLQVNDTSTFNDGDDDILHQQMHPPTLGDSDRVIKIDKFELEREILELEIRIKELEIKKKTLEIKLCKLNET